MNARLQGLALIALCATGCASPAYVIENSEHPLFLGDSDLLTARRDSQEVNVRHIREGGARLQQSWLDPLSPAGRSFKFDPTWGRILSVGRQVEGENPLRSGPPRHRRSVKAGLLSPDAAFSLRSWPGGSELVTRTTSPGLARTADGDLVLRRSREAQFELYDTTTGRLVARGPLVAAGPLSEGAPAPPRLSAACFTGPKRFVYAWEGQVFLGELRGESCSSERLSAGSSLAYRDGRLFVLVKNRWLRAFELETRRALWQVELSALALEAEALEAPPRRPWSLVLTPDGRAIAVNAHTTFEVLSARQGQSMLGPDRSPAGARLESFSLANDSCALLYSTETPAGPQSLVRARDYGPNQLGSPVIFETSSDPGAPFSRIALSGDSDWLAISAGAEVQVWRVRAAAK